MSTSVEALKSSISLIRYNPTEIQRHIHRILPEASNGTLDVVDPSNPFTFLVEAMATCAASAAAESAANNRKQYASVAQNMQDLYRHMSDHDFTDIFAMPSKASFIFGFAKDELLQAMVAVPGSDMRKIVIPRNTTITVGSVLFSLQYPIEIRQMGHGGITVVWDVEKTTPLLTLDTNIIENSTVTNSHGVELLMFAAPMSQFFITSSVETANLARKFEMNIPITDKFYYCRVWRETSSGQWAEIDTTYSQEIYPANKPTAIVIVEDSQVRIEIPIVYMKTGLISGKIRVDVYQTRGPLSMDLSSYSSESYVANWLAVDKSEQTDYVAPLKNIKTMMLFSNTVVSGGMEQMSFEDLRDRVMSNGFGPDQLAITPAQAQSRLERNGYNIVKSIDHVTDRIFKATKEMPSPEDRELITPASAGVHMLSESLERLGLLPTAYVNTNTLTLSPETLYAIENGVVRVVPQSERLLLDNMPGDKKALAVTNGAYYYSPFHYVMDTTNDTFALRPYYLEDPKISSRSFIAENDTTLLQVSVANYQISRTANGWELILFTTSSEQWRAIAPSRVFVNIGYQPDRTGDYAYIPGSMIGLMDSGEQVWKFEINTTYDINSDHAIELSNAMMYESSQQFHRMVLEQSFDVFFSTSEPMPIGWQASSFDHLIGSFLVEDGSVGVSRERVNLSFGSALTNLWSRARSVVSDDQYVKWEVDVLDTYEEDEYEKDPVTGSITYTIVGNEVLFNKLHAKGDQKYDSEGEPLYRWRKGDIKRDAYGRPMVSEARKVIRQMDLFLLEAAYYFATNSAAVDYRSRLVRALVGWITTELAQINRQLLDKTQIFYTPTQNVGQVEVIYGAGLKTTIAAGQYFNLKLYLKDTVYKNEELKEKLRLSTISTIAACLKSKTVSNSAIVEALRDAYGEDVISFDISGLGGVNKLTLLTMVDDSARLTLRKRLDFRNDQTFAVAEDVTVEFVAHERAGVVLDL